MAGEPAGASWGASTASCGRRHGARQMAHACMHAWPTTDATLTAPHPGLFLCLHRERILSSLSLYELARRFWQQQDYERSLVAVEQSIALKLFPYTDMKLLTRWQQSLVTPGYLFKRPKLELADALILKANCMYELGRREQSVEYLYQALEAIHLSAAMMHSSMVGDGVWVGAHVTGPEGPWGLSHAWPCGMLFVLASWGLCVCPDVRQRGWSCSKQLNLNIARRWSTRMQIRRTWCRRCWPTLKRCHSMWGPRQQTPCSG